MKVGGGWPALFGIMVLVGAALVGWGIAAPPAMQATATADVPTALVRIGAGEPPSYAVAPGGEASITVEVVGAANLGAATLLLAYDSSQVQVIGCTAQPPAGVDLAVCNANYSTGLVRFSLLAASGLSGDYPLFTLTLRASAPAGATAQLALTAPQFADIQGVELPVLTTGGALLVTGPGQTAEAVVRIEPQAAAVIPGQHTTVAVMLDAAAARPVLAATMLVQYDPSIVRPVQCTPPAGSQLQGACNPNFNATQGLIKFNLVAPEGVSGLLQLYDITFEVVGTAVPGAVSLLTLTVETMVDSQSNSLRWQAMHGAVTVIAGPTNAAQLLVGAPGTDGAFVLEHGADLVVPVWVVDAANLGAATLLLDYDPALLEPLGCTVHNNAGLDGGNCTIQEGRVLAYIISGQGFNGSALLFEVRFTPRSGAPAGVAAALLLDAANFADASAAPLPWRARGGFIDLAPGAPSNLPLVGLGLSTGAPQALAQNGQITITASISGAVELGAATVIIRFDPAVVALVGCTPVGPFDGAACIPGDGELRVTFLSGSGFTGSAPIVELVLRAADNADVGDQTNLALAVTTFSSVDGDALRYQVATGAVQITAAEALAVDALLRLNPPSFDVRPGTQITVDVEALLDTVTLPQGLDIVTLRLLYDPAVVRPLACVMATQAFQGGGCNLAYAPGQIRFSLLGGTATGKLNLAQISFEAVGQPGDSALLRLAVDQLLAPPAAAPTYRVERATVQITVDGDGVSDAVENGGPNNGDGNGDGVPDAGQLHVTSLPNPFDGQYVTVVGPPSSCLADLQFAANPSPGDAPAGWSFPLGFIRFTLECLPPGSTALVTVLLHDNGASQFDQFFIYGAPAPPNTDGWLPFPLQSNTGAVLEAGRILLHLVDGQRGDGDGVNNGRIVFLGAPGKSGVAVAAAPLALALVEGGSAQHYRVALLARPVAPVLITLATDGQAVVAPEQLFFALDSWSVVQTVTVSAVNDGVLEGRHADLIRHTVSSADAAYNALPVADVAVTIDEVPPTPTPTPTPTITPGGPTLTPTPTITPGGPTLTPTPTITPGGPTLTPTPTITPGGPTLTPTPTATSSSEDRAVSYLPAIMVETMAMRNSLFLPLVARPGLPDLVVEQIVRGDGSLQVVIRNIGAAPVTEEFWIDAYVAPSTPPWRVNQTWDMMGAEGMVWGVTAAALPLAPGARLTLAIGDLYYLPEYSSVALPLAAGRTVYVQVDSYGEAGDYGAVLESHEQDGQPYNNISEPASGAQADPPGAWELQPAAPPAHTAPPRRRRMLPDRRTREVK